jgi:hypothetical protein
MIPYEFIQIEKTYLICYPNGTIFHLDKSKTWKPISSQDNGTGYLITSISSGGKAMLLCHRIIAYAFGIINNLYSPYQIDHRDRNKLNNCVFNLRAVSNQQNQLNKMSTSKGYYLHPTNKWLAKIMINGKNKHLGYFEKEEDAVKAVKIARETPKNKIFLPKTIVINDLDNAKLALFTTAQNIKKHSLKFPKKT